MKSGNENVYRRSMRRRKRRQRRRRKLQKRHVWRRFYLETNVAFLSVDNNNNNVDNFDSIASNQDYLSYKFIACKCVVDSAAWKRYAEFQWNRFKKWIEIIMMNGPYWPLQKKATEQTRALFLPHSLALYPPIYLSLTLSLSANYWHEHEQWAHCIRLVNRTL